MPLILCSGKLYKTIFVVINLNDKKNSVWSSSKPKITRTARLRKFQYYEAPSILSLGKVGTYIFYGCQLVQQTRFFTKSVLTKNCRSHGDLKILVLPIKLFQFWIQANYVFKTFSIAIRLCNKKRFSIKSV